MSKALSLDLRVRVLVVVQAGATHRQAAERFGVSAASVSRWRAREREQGDARPKALGGYCRSKRIEACGEAVLAALGPDGMRPSRKYAARLRHMASASASGRSSASSIAAITRKKVGARLRASRPDIWSSARPGSKANSTLTPSTWCSSTRPGPPPTWRGVTVALARSTAADRRSARTLENHDLHRRLDAARLHRAVGPRRRRDRRAFETYVEKVLVPKLRQGDVVIMDNLAGHKGPTCVSYRSRGARIIYLPPYTPDFNPIENAFAKLKALLRKAAERTSKASGPHRPTHRSLHPEEIQNSSPPQATVQRDRIRSRIMVCEIARLAARLRALIVTFRDSAAVAVVATFWGSFSLGL